MNKKNSASITNTVTVLVLLNKHSGSLNVCLCHRVPSVVKGNSTLPPEDRLLKFLVDNNGEAEETVQCANCDQESNNKVQTDRQTVPHQFTFRRQELIVLGT